MNIEDIIGVSSACSDATSRAVGSYGCPFKFQLPDGVILLKKGFFVPAGQDFSKTYLQGLIQEGIAIPLLNSFGFEPINEDDVLETSVTGVNDLARKGLTSLKFMFKKGIAFEKELEKLTSFGRFDVWVVDKSGNFLGVEKSGGFGGWSAGLALARAKTWNTGSESEGKDFEIQLTQPGERKNVTWIEASQLDFFAPTEIDGVNPVVLTFEDALGPVPPASSDTSLKIKAVASDGSTPIEGLTDSDFLVEIDGAIVNVTGASETSPGFYDVTVAVSAGALQATLYDAVLGAEAVLVNEYIFAGKVQATVV